MSWPFTTPCERFLRDTNSKATSLAPLSCGPTANAVVIQGQGELLTVDISGGVLGAVRAGPLQATVSVPRTVGKLEPGEAMQRLRAI